MYDSTLADDWRALITFQQMIVLCDADGTVDMTPHSIARRTGIPIEHIEAGLKILEAPDPYSRTPDQSGRRIQRLDDHRPWGWSIINHAYYRALQDADTVREQNRIRKQRQRERENEAGECPGINVTNRDSHAMSRHTNTNTDTDTSSCPDNGSGRRKYEFTQEDMDIAESIYSGVLSINPSMKKPNLDSWANTIRLTREQDARQPDEITALFEWANKDGFWQSNILSPEKLRKQWDTLVVKRKAPTDNFEGVI
jgi:hypothetical protein